MSDTATIVFMFSYVIAFMLFAISFYFVWFKGDSYQRFMNRLFDKTYLNRFFGSHTKTKRYLRDQRLAITVGLALVLAFALAVILRW